MSRLNADCIHRVADFCEVSSNAAWYCAHGLRISETPSFRRIALSLHRRASSTVLAQMPRAVLEWHVPAVKGNPFWPEASGMANLVITPVCPDQSFTGWAPWWPRGSDAEQNQIIILVEYEARGLFCADNASQNGREGAKCVCAVVYSK